MGRAGSSVRDMVRIVKGLRQWRGGLAVGLPGVLVGVLLVGCGAAPQRSSLPSVVVPASGTPVLPGTAAASLSNLPPVAAAALTQLGVPYRLGGADPAGFDCSGLVQWAFAVAGTKVPRTTEEQFSWFKAVPREELQPGDLVFFRLPQAHVGIYLGAGEFVHAPASGRAVERARLDSPWFILSFAGGGRVPAL